VFLLGLVGLNFNFDSLFLKNCSITSREQFENEWVKVLENEQDKPTQKEEAPNKK
jgi:hypothetical protein